MLTVPSHGGAFITHTVVGLLLTQIPRSSDTLEDNGFSTASCCISQSTLSPTAERTMNGYWNIDGATTIRGDGVGRIIFQVLRTRHLVSYKWMKGRLKKVQDTTRLDSVRPDQWLNLSKRHTQHDIELLDKKDPKLQAARRDRRIFEIHLEDEVYSTTLPEARYDMPQAPAMLCAHLGQCHPCDDSLEILMLRQAIATSNIVLLRTVSSNKR